MTQDSIGHLKTLCMHILWLSGGVESEWKHCSSLLSIEKNALCSSMNPALHSLLCRYPDTKLYSTRKHAPPPYQVYRVVAFC